ncbi:hypothetical protein Sjap_022213 [Stephania japonica]|uniref:Uncharacterized protein n=1 Tax=Stephania japonica TaxID=461633 RepID=A0AAP0ENZ2_9MAGN
MIGTGRGRLDGPGSSSIRGGCRVLLGVTVFLPICIIPRCFGDFCGGDRCNDQGMVGDSIAVVHQSPDVPKHPHHSGYEFRNCFGQRGEEVASRGWIAQTTSHRKRKAMYQPVVKRAWKVRVEEVKDHSHVDEGAKGAKDVESDME